MKGGKYVKGFLAIIAALGGVIAVLLGTNKRRNNRDLQRHFQRIGDSLSDVDTNLGRAADSGERIADAIGGATPNADEREEYTNVHESNRERFKRRATDS